MRVPALATTVLLAAGAAFAQDAPPPARPPVEVLRDQEWNLEQLRNLKARMGALADRFEREGDRDKAEILRSAVKLADEKRIEDLMHEVIKRIQQGRPQEGAEKADEARAAVAEILALLEQRGRDRAAEEKLRELAEARQRAGKLLDRQREIRKETEARRQEAESSADPAYERGRKEIEEAARELDRVDEEVRRAAERRDDADARAAGLDDLAREQERLAADLENAGASAPKAVAAALERLRALAADAERAAEGAALVRTVEEALRRAAALE
ncbi:MAG TPA: hypothetical protein VFS92_06050, partial [Planctomycetota bacterium]|nr:hypothetical protein [Planctomycetota bacterium]